MWDWVVVRVRVVVGVWVVLSLGGGLVCSQVVLVLGCGVGVGVVWSQAVVCFYIVLKAGRLDISSSLVISVTKNVKINY